MPQRILILFTLVMSVANTACVKELDLEPTHTTPREPFVQVEGDETITYHAHIKPLMSQYCVSCHQPGGIGPFTLTSFEDASTWGRPSAIAVRGRTMPPFLANDSGDCNRFRESSWLTEADIEVFEAWVEQGMQEGDASLPDPAPRSLPELTGALESVDTGHDYTPDQTRTDDYRCFVIDSPGRFAATGFDVIPSNPRIAHHLIAYQVQNERQAEKARELDAEAPGPGYPCFGTGPQVDAFTVASWAPGAGATIFPEGTGMEIDGELPLILEMHYNIAGGPGESDRTTLAFQTAPAGSVNQLYELWALDYDFEGPPGLESFTTTERTPIKWPLADFDQRWYRGKIKVYGANAHMHELGKSMMIAVDSEVDRCLLDIPRWDFNWQLTYWYEEPIEISARDDFYVTCEWTTRGRDEPLVWGDGTGDEMCLGGIYVTLED